MPALSDCPPVPRWSFTQGVLIGQASIFLLALLILKYIVFETPSPRPPPTPRAKRPLAPPLVSPSSILHSLAYDLPTHAPESLDWLNVLLAQTLGAYRALVEGSTAGRGGARGLMEDVLSRKSGEEGMLGMDRIEVGNVALGEGFPVLSNARVRPSGDGGVRIELDVDYTDHVSLAISTSLCINFPRPRFAVLPISLSLTLERFSGTLTLELPPPSTTHPTLHLSLHPDFTLDLSTTSLLGSRAKLQDIPKVEQLILSRIRAWIQDRVVWPGRVEIGLPGVLQAVPPVVSGEGLEGWEWVEDSLDGTEVDKFPVVPNADSDDGEEATVDMDADGGPSVMLNPKVRRRSSLGEKEWEREGGYRPPSPTESLPGFYRAGMGERRGRWTQRGRGVPTGLRYRTGGGVGGVGMGVGGSVGSRGV